MKVWLGKDVQSKLAGEGLSIPMVIGTADAIQNPFFKQIASEIEKSQWIAIAIDQQLGPDTGRVFNDVSVEWQPEILRLNKPRKRSKIPGLRTECKTSPENRLAARSFHILTVYSLH